MILQVHDRTWSIAPAADGMIDELGARIETETGVFDTRHGEASLSCAGDTCTIALGPFVIELACTDTADEESALAVSVAMTLHNRSAEDQRVRTVHALRYEGDWSARGLFTCSSRSLVHTVPVERCYGFDGSHGIAHNEPRTSAWIVLLHDPDICRSIVLGIDSIPAGIVRWHLTPLQSHAAGMRVMQWQCTIDVLSGTRGVRIPAGASLALGSARIAVSSASDEDALRAHARRLARQCGVRLPARPPSGWCSWYAGYASDVTERDILDNLAAASPMPALEVLQIDDGWMRGEGTRTTGEPVVDARKFPRGMKALADDIASAGKTPGLWLRPLEGWGERGDAPSWARGACIDASHPDARAWLCGLSRRIVHEWGFRYLKLDFLAFDMFGEWGMALPEPASARFTPHDDTRTNAMIARDALRALREGAGEDAVIIGCNAMFGTSVGLVDGMRIGDDVDAANPDRIEIMGMRSIDALQWMNGVLWWNDPDCILVHEPLSVEDARRWAMCVHDAGGVGMVSSPLHHLSAERRALIVAALPVRIR